MSFNKRFNWLSSPFTLLKNERLSLWKLLHSDTEYKLQDKEWAFKGTLWLLAQFTFLSQISLLLLKFPDQIILS